MVPPESIFGVIDTWVGVYAALVVSLGFSGYVFYGRVISQLMRGRREFQFDKPLLRLANFVQIVLGQKKVMQRVSIPDKAGIGHVVIFFGFLSFLLSYGIFIFGDSIWPQFSEKILSSQGVKVYAIYLDIVSALILMALGWAVVRRWLVRPSRLKFDLTRSKDSVLIVALIGSLMVSTILAEAFFVAEATSRGTVHPEMSVIIGGALGRALHEMGLGLDAANLLHGLFWWIHLLVILGFSIYIPFSKHMHLSLIHI